AGVRGFPKFKFPSCLLVDEQTTAAAQGVVRRDSNTYKNPLRNDDIEGASPRPWSSDVLRNKARYWDHVRKNRPQTAFTVRENGGGEEQEEKIVVGKKKKDEQGKILASTEQEPPTSRQRPATADGRVVVTSRNRTSTHVDETGGGDHVEARGRREEQQITAKETKDSSCQTILLAEQLKPKVALVSSIIMGNKNVQHNYNTNQDNDDATSGATPFSVPFPPPAGERPSRRPGTACAAYGGNSSRQVRLSRMFDVDSNPIICPGSSPGSGSGGINIGENYRNQDERDRPRGNILQQQRPQTADGACYTNRKRTQQVLHNVYNIAKPPVMREAGESINYGGMVSPFSSTAHTESRPVQQPVQRDVGFLQAAHQLEPVLGERRGEEKEEEEPAVINVIPGGGQQHELAEVTFFDNVSSTTATAVRVSKSRIYPAKIYGERVMEKRIAERANSNTDGRVCSPSHAAEVRKERTTGEQNYDAHHEVEDQVEQSATAGVVVPVHTTAQALLAPETGEPEPPGVPPLLIQEKLQPARLIPRIPFPKPVVDSTTACRHNLMNCKYDFNARIAPTSHRSSRPGSANDTSS
ncbi:unnamed protein product, partial [Amoebophrya sp. A120]